MRSLFIILGLLSLALGIIGIFLPLLPTTPFVLLAAFLFARSSKKMHHWLLSNKHFGPTLTQWEENRSISKQVKIRAIVIIVLTFSVSITFFIPGTEFQLLVAACALIPLFILLRIPTSAS